MADVTDTAGHDEPVAAYLNRLLSDAAEHAISDIHIEPHTERYRIRFRRDGLLYEADSLPVSFAIRLITRLKILGELNIAEKRLPQDGRLPPGCCHNLDIRLNTCPALHGEKMALRLLHTSAASPSLASLGMTPIQLQSVLHHLAAPQGLILVAGPTGSGKTQTLYAMLTHLNHPTRHLATVEDPIEIELPGITQVAIRPNLGLTFAAVLRTLLRQDPDILMIGEIRDLETATIALQAAQTGHLVLATIHATHAHATFNRLAAIGIAPNIVSSCLSLIIAQRLIRTLCTVCQQTGSADTTCKHCIHGYRGRTGIFECLSVSVPDDHLIENITLREAANLKRQQHLTDHAEINRVLGP